MKTQNIDSTIKKAIDDSANFYDLEANKAKERIWLMVQAKKKNHSWPILLRSIVAACFLLIICTTAISILFFKARESIQTLKEANSILMKNSTVNGQNILVMKTPVDQANIRSTDTIYKEKKVIVYKPVISKIKVVDTVYVKQLVYVEKEQSPELTTADKINIVIDSSYQKAEQDYKKEIFISNNELIKKEKRKKFQIKLGGEKNQENYGTLAFTTKL